MEHVVVHSLVVIYGFYQKVGVRWISLKGESTHVDRYSVFGACMPVVGYGFTDFGIWS